MSNAFDPTENIRREMVEKINAEPVSVRAELESQYGLANVWDTNELTARFEVLSFLAPFAIVRDRVTGKNGSVLFQHSPRYYFNFEADPDKGRW